MSNYKEKYLKYKQKYVNLQKGGEFDENEIIKEHSKDYRTSKPGVNTRKAYAESKIFFAAYYEDNPGLKFDRLSEPTDDNLKYYEIQENIFEIKKNIMV